MEVFYKIGQNIYLLKTHQPFCRKVAKFSTLPITNFRRRNVKNEAKVPNTFLTTRHIPNQTKARTQTTTLSSSRKTRVKFAGSGQRLSYQLCSNALIAQEQVEFQNRVLILESYWKYPKVKSRALHKGVVKRGRFTCRAKRYVGPFTGSLWTASKFDEFRGCTYITVDLYIYIWNKQTNKQTFETK